jgi:hypothetical protein
LSLLLKSSLTPCGYELRSEKKISLISSSRSKFKDGFAFLIFLSYKINFSTNNDKVNSILIDLSSCVGIWTILSFSTIFSTITSFGTWTILGNKINCSSYAVNFSIISIWRPKAGFVVLSFRISASNMPMFDFKLAVKTLYRCSCVETSTPTATPRVSYSTTSWTYFKT